MGRKDAAKIAQQLINQSESGGIHKQDTPVHILEAVSTSRERLWSSTLQELADGKAETWFNCSSPVLIIVGEALRAEERQSKTIDSKPFSTEINNSLQYCQIFPNSRRRA
jgi:uroporphyrin-III C-methyltransferase